MCFSARRLFLRAANIYFLVISVLTCLPTSPKVSHTVTVLRVCAPSIYPSPEWTYTHAHTHTSIISLARFCLLAAFSLFAFSFIVPSLSFSLFSSFSPFLYGQRHCSLSRHHLSSVFLHFAVHLVPLFSLFFRLSPLFSPFSIHYPTPLPSPLLSQDPISMIDQAHAIPSPQPQQSFDLFDTLLGTWKRNLFISRFGKLRSHSCFMHVHEMMRTHRNSARHWSGSAQRCH